MTLAISAYVLWHGLSEIGGAIRLLMLDAPESPSLREVAGAMREAERWRTCTISTSGGWTSGESPRRRMSGSARAHPTARRAKAAIREALDARFGFRHVTLETEFPGEACQSTGGPEVAEPASRRSRSQM